MAQVAKGKGQRTKAELAETILTAKMPDLRAVEKVLERTRGSLEDTYSKGSAANKCAVESARNELVRFSLAVAQEAIGKLKKSRLEGASLRDLCAVFKTMIQMANTLTEQFKEEENKKVTEMTDEELEELSKSDKDKVN